MKIKGRGASAQIPNRFDRQQRDDSIRDEVFAEEPEPLPRTQFIDDNAKSILTRNQSPDIAFDFSLNPYRGCEHGCAYCYARPTHEYLGFSPGLDFETKILVKKNAPELLREALLKPGWVPQPIMLSGVTDCYQPVERKLEITRRCLTVLRDFKSPAGVITKNSLVTRDLDILRAMHDYRGCQVWLSMTTLDSDLCGVLEPRTSRPAARLRAIHELASAGIPVGVNVAPIIPGLTDAELPRILQAAAHAGARLAGYVPLRLPLAVAPLFEQWLADHVPGQKEKVLNHQRSLRGGKLNDANFTSRMRGEGAFAENLRQMFNVYTKKYGLNAERFELSTASFARPVQQLSLL